MNELTKEELIHIITHPESASMHRVHLVARELLSLREQLAEKEERLCRLRTSLEIEMKGHEAAERQLAELKALEPAAYLIHEKGGSRQLRFLGLDSVSQADIEEHELWQEPLFKAAKSVELDNASITEHMRRAFWSGFESARGTENSNIPADWKDSKPNLLLALNAKMSGA